MSDKRRGLGRGLGALIPTAPGQREDAGRLPGPSPVDLVIAGSAAPVSAPARPETDDGAPGDTPGVPSPLPDQQPRPGEADEGNVRYDPAREQEAAVDPVPPQAPTLAEVPGARFAELPLAAIRPNPRQPRQVFEEEAMQELVSSLQEVGLLQPVVVREAGSGEGGGPEYELIMGERRWRASQLAGFSSIPAIIRSTSDDDLLRDALLENLHRSQLNPLEEAAAYQQLLEDFGCSHEELATRIGRSRPQISNTLRLLRLTPTVQRRVAAGVLSAGHARALVSLESAEAQDHLATRIVAEGLSVRAVEEIVALGAAEPDSASTRVRRSRPVSPRLGEFAETLSERYETRVKIDLGRKRGKITVEFASLDDLERILGLMMPPQDEPETAP